MVDETLPTQEVVGIFEMVGPELWVFPISANVSVYDWWTCSIGTKVRKLSMPALKLLTSVNQCAYLALFAANLYDHLLMLSDEVSYTHKRVRHCVDLLRSNTFGKGKGVWVSPFLQSRYKANRKYLSRLPFLLCESDWYYINGTGTNFGS